MCDHGIEVAGAYQHAEAWSAEGEKVGCTVPVRLRKHGDTVAVRLKHSCDDRRTEARVIDVCVAGDEQKVVPPPASLLHIFF